MLWLYKTGVFVSKIDLGFTGISDAEYLTNRKVKRAEIVSIETEKTSDYDCFEYHQC